MCSKKYNQKKEIKTQKTQKSKRKLKFIGKEKAYFNLLVAILIMKGK